MDKPIKFARNSRYDIAYYKKNKKNYNPTEVSTKRFFNGQLFAFKIMAVTLLLKYSIVNVYRI